MAIDPKWALDVLLSLTARLTDDRPLEEFLKAVTDATLDVLEADHASIRLLDASGTALLTGARSGLGEHAPPAEFLRGVGVLGWVVEQGLAARIDDVEQDPRWIPSDRQTFAIRSLLAVPLYAGGQVTGVLAASSAATQAFKDDSQLLLQLLANCSAPAIERARLRRLAMFDDLTMAFTQRYLGPRLSEELERTRRGSGDVSVLYMDLDNFKAVNDAYGHAAGDAVLRIFAQRVRAAVRRIDALFRRGGEEFILVMPATGAPQAVVTAERVLRVLRESPIVLDDGRVVQQTVSIGAATWDGRELPAQLEHRADQAMYEAKRQGRDRVVAAVRISGDGTPSE